MKIFKTLLIRRPLKALAVAGLTAPFRWILGQAITEHPDSRPSNDGQQLTVLALSPEGFRQDLEVLAKTGRCRVLVMASRWQYRFMYLFYNEGLRVSDYMNPAPDSTEMKSKRELQNFYGRLLPKLYDRLGIDCVVSYHIRAPADVDWGIASRKAGYPYVVLFREGLIAASPDLREVMPVRFKRFGFWGTHVIVHNESARQLCIDTALAKPEAVSALGCLRMDGFLSRIKKKNEAHQRKRQVTFFPFSLRDKSKWDFSLWPVFSGAHVALAKLAMKYPDVDFVFKPKPKGYAGWRRLVDKAFAEAGMDARQLPNLVMDPNLDAQKLILESSVVCGINSTTILEAAIACRPVVVPFFREFREKPFVDNVKFADAFQYLDVADDPESFAKLIEDRLVKPEISKSDMAGRRAMFKKYVSDPDGGALDKYLQQLESLVAESRSRRGASFSAVPGGRSGAFTAGAKRTLEERHGTD
jgi:hypothetical protein